MVLSDELAQDETEAEDYDLESFGRRGRGHPEDDDDDATLVGRRGDETISNDIVFEIGEEDGGSEDEDENKTKKRRTERSRRDNGQGEESRGLVTGRED